VTRAMRVLSMSVVVLAAAVLIGWFFSYHPTSFRGAGRMRDGGFLSYPRYHAPLGEFPLASEGAYTFKFSGLPAEDMTLLFYVPGYNISTHEVIEELSTKLSAVVTDASGKVICSASGSPNGTRDDDRWVVMSSRNEAALWHHACLERPFARRRDYALRVAVSNVDPKTPHVTLTVMLEGGGTEAP
jgi:hypothetical protein